MMENADEADGPDVERSLKQYRIFSQRRLLSEFDDSSDAEPEILKTIHDDENEHF